MSEQKRTISLNIGKKAGPVTNVAHEHAKSNRADIFDLNAVLDVNKDGVVDMKDVKFAYPDLHFPLVAKARNILPYLITEPFILFGALCTGFSAWISYQYYGHIMENSTQLFGLFMAAFAVSALFAWLYSSSTTWSEAGTKLIIMAYVTGTAIADATANRGWLGLGQGTAQVRLGMVKAKQDSALTSYTTNMARKTRMEAAGGIRSSASLKALMLPAGKARFKIRGRTGTVASRCPGNPRHPRCKSYVALSKELKVAEEYETVVATIAKLEAGGFGQRGKTEQTNSNIHTDAVAQVLGLSKHYAGAHALTWQAWLLVALQGMLLTVGMSRVDKRRRKNVAAAIDMEMAKQTTPEAKQDDAAAKLNVISANLKKWAKPQVSAAPAVIAAKAVDSKNQSVESWIGTLVPKAGNWLKKQDYYQNWLTFCRINNVNWSGSITDFDREVGLTGKLPQLSRNGKPGYAGFALPA